MDVLGDTLDNVGRGCVFQRKPILQHFEKGADKWEILSVQ